MYIASVITHKSHFQRSLTFEYFKKGHVGFARYLSCQSEIKQSVGGLEFSSVSSVNGKGNSSLVIPLVTDNIFDFLKYAVTTLFALGDRKIKNVKGQIFVVWVSFHSSKHQSGYNLKSNFVLSSGAF
jgi:hypothetical protein